MNIYVVAPAVFITMVLILYAIPKFHFRRLTRGRLFEDYIRHEDARRADGTTVCIHCQSDRIWHQTVYRNLSNGINRHWCRNCSRELYFTVYGDRMRKGLGISGLPRHNQG